MSLTPDEVHARARQLAENLRDLSRPDAFRVVAAVDAAMLAQMLASGETELLRQSLEHSTRVRCELGARSASGALVGALLNHLRVGGGR